MRRIGLSEPTLGLEEKEALCRVIDDQWLASGDRVKEFERAFAALHGHPDAVATSSCTTALHLALLGLGIGPGHEVIVPSLTFVATANAVIYAGATPVLADIESPVRPHLSLAEARALWTPRTRAVVVMHYGGWVADMASWRAFCDEKGLLLIEDAAHAPGAGGVGRYADASAFSFYSNKNITTGEGGMLLLRGQDLDRVRRLRSHAMTSTTLDRERGHAFSYDVVETGYNYRLDELRGALGLAQLPRLLAWNARRRELSALYRRLFAEGLAEVLVPFADDPASAGHLMPALLPRGTDRTAIMAALRAQGVQSSVHYPPIHGFTSHARHARGRSLAQTDDFCARELSLPLHPALSEDDVALVVDLLGQALGQARP